MYIYENVVVNLIEIKKTSINQIKFTTETAYNYNKINISNRL